MKHSEDSNVGRINPAQKESVERLDPGEPIAVFLVGGEHDLGPSAIRVFSTLYSQDYRQILFLSVGVLDFEVVDAGVGEHGYGDPEKAKHLQMKTRAALDPYLVAAHDLGMKADCRISIATDPVEEIDQLSTQIALTYPRSVFYVSKLIFQRPNWFHRFLGSGTSDAIRKRLEKKGYPVTVISVVVPV